MEARADKTLINFEPSNSLSLPPSVVEGASFGLPWCGLLVSAGLAVSADWSRVASVAALDCLSWARGRRRLAGLRDFVRLSVAARQQRRHCFRAAGEGGAGGSGAGEVGAALVWGSRLTAAGLQRLRPQLALNPSIPLQLRQDLCILLSVPGNRV